MRRVLWAYLALLLLPSAVLAQAWPLEGEAEPALPNAQPPSEALAPDPGPEDPGAASDGEQTPDAERAPPGPPRATTETGATSTAPSPPDENLPPPPLDVSDPTMSAPLPGLAPELAPPTVDLIAANLSVSTNGARVSASITPFRLLDRPIPFLSQASLRVTADSSAQSWGVGLTLGHNSARQSLYTPRHVCGVRFDASVGALEREVLAQLERAGVTIPPSLQPGTSSTPDTQRLAALIGLLPPATNPQRHRDLLTRHQNDRARCLARDYRRFAVEVAFDNAFAINLTLAANFFAFVDEPAVIDMNTMAPTDPTAEMVRDYAATLSGAFFVSRQAAFWLNFALSRRRPDARTAQLDTRLGLGAVLAGFVPIAPPTSDGFRPGLAFGLGATYTVCLEEEGTDGSSCREKLEGYPSAARISDAVQIVPFFDVRLDSKLQLRLAVAVDAFVLDRPVMGTEAMTGDVVWRVLPTLSATTSAWSF